MGFQNPKSVGLPTDVKKEAKKREIQQQIDALNTTKESLDKEIQAKEEARVEFLGASESINDKLAELSELYTRIATLKQDLDIGNKKLASLKDLDDKIASAKETLTSYEEKSQAFADLDEQLMTKQGDLNTFILEYNQKIDEKTNKLTELNKELANKQDKLGRLNEELGSKLESGVLVTKEYDLLNKKVDSTQQLHKDLTAKIENLKEMYKNVEINAKNELAGHLAGIKDKFDSENAKKVADLEKREGELNDQIKWLETDKKYLRTVKAELEQIYKKKINVNI